MKIKRRSSAPHSRRSLALVITSSWVVLGIGSVLAGLLAQGIGLTAGWLVGPMLTAIALALTWPKPPKLPRRTRLAPSAIIGTVLAAAFRPSVVPLMLSNWLPIGFVVGGTLLVSLVVGILLTRSAHLDGRTAMLGTLPGAASGMLAMSDSLGADPRLVALMQYTRVIVVVVSAAVVSRIWLDPEAATYLSPNQGLQAAASQDAALVHEAWLTYVLTVLTAALGAWLGTRLRLPAGTMLGPLILGIGLEESGILQLSWPPGVPQVGYLVLGVYVGLLFDRASFQRAGRLFPYVLGSAMGLVAMCAGLSWLLSALAPIDGLTAYLATSPGGMDSVAIMALGSGADVALVLAIQFLRLLAVVLAGSLLGRWWSS